MIAQGFSGISAETSTARTLCDFFRDQRHRAVEADVKDFVAGFQAGVGFLVLHERAEPADAGGDRPAAPRGSSGLTRPGQQFLPPLAAPVRKRAGFWKCPALRLFFLGL